MKITAHIARLTDDNPFFAEKIPFYLALYADDLAKDIGLGATLLSNRHAMIRKGNCARNLSL